MSPSRFTLYDKIIDKQVKYTFLRLADLLKQGFLNINITE